MSGEASIDFNKKELRERFLEKREDPISLNNQIDAPTLLSMLGPIASRSILEIGCGAGSLAEVLADRGAGSYLGVDRSIEMVELAKRRLLRDGFDFRVIDVEQQEIPGADFEIVISALTFHFLRDWDNILRKVWRCLVNGGQFAFSIRHPIRTSNPLGLCDRRESWGVRDYFSEGPREITWHGHPVVIYHRTFSTIISAILNAGFVVDATAEVAPTPDKVHGDDRDHMFVPGLLHFHCIKA